MSAGVPGEVKGGDEARVSGIVVSAFSCSTNSLSIVLVEEALAGGQQTEE